MSIKVAFYTLGCKLNFSETSSIARGLKDGSSNFVEVDFSEKADFYIINTCSVTEQADKKFRFLARQTLRKNPERKLIAIGCYAQLQPEEISKFDKNIKILGASEKFEVEKYLNEFAQKEKSSEISNPIHSCEISKVETFESAYSYGDRTRAFVKIQDGCDYKCTYCTIPQARGKSRNTTISETIKNLKKLDANNIQEIVLTGVNTGDFGQQSNENFYTLLKAILEETQIPRIRISSIEPNLLTSEIIDLISVESRIVPHLHIPLQSGSDLILQKMKRRYNTTLYQKKMEEIYQKIPHIGIGCDVIVGFPGETEEIFEETFNFIQSLPISYLHVFPFSERPNTEAESMVAKVSGKDKKHRSEKLRELSNYKNLLFLKSQKNKVRNVLFENENKKGKMQGFTDNYIKVERYWTPELAGKIVPVTLESLDTNQRQYEYS